MLGSLGLLSAALILFIAANLAIGGFTDIQKVNPEPFHGPVVVVEALG
jgi:hypothetical protein